MLKEVAPTTLAGLPSWATGEQEQEEQHNRSSDPSEEGLSGGVAAKDSASDDDGSSAATELGAPGSLARELRSRVFTLEQTVFELEGKLRLADEARLARRRDGDGGVLGGENEGGGVQRHQGGVFEGEGGSSSASPCYSSLVAKGERLVGRACRGAVSH